LFKVAILGCENSHANAFLKAVYEEKLFADVEFVGVYSADQAAAEKLNRKYGVRIADTYDEFVGKVDGIMITARHGDDHYKFAKPYMESGIPMFIDKPITCSEEEAKAFRDELEANHVRVCGGSTCIHADHVQNLKRAVEEQEYGRTYGGFLRAPINLDNPYGGFYFYTQHLAQVTMEIFGYYPKSVQAVQNGEVINCLVRYEDYDVHLSYVDHVNKYSAHISSEMGVFGDTYVLTGCYNKEFANYHELLLGKEQRQRYEDFFAPVYVINALKRALESGKEENVHRYLE